MVLNSPGRSDWPWLVADGSMSPLLVDFDIELDCWDLSPNERFVFGSSFSDASGSPLNESDLSPAGSMISPIEEECGCSCCSSSESGDYFSFGEASSGFGSSPASLCIGDETLDCFEDFDSLDAWFSLLDLDVVDSEWDYERDQGYNVFESNDFPSPSFKAARSLKLLPCRCLEASFVAENFSDGSEEPPGCEEPLFWPFDLKSYGHPESEKLLCMSPLKNLKSSELQGFYPEAAKPVRRKLKLPAGRKIIRALCEKKAPSSASTEGKTEASHLGHDMINAGPTMMSEWNPISSHHSLLHDVSLIRIPKNFIV